MKGSGDNESGIIFRGRDTAREGFSALTNEAPRSLKSRDKDRHFLANVSRGGRKPAQVYGNACPFLPINDDEKLSSVVCNFQKLKGDSRHLEDELTGFSLAQSVYNIFFELPSSTKLCINIS